MPKVYGVIKENNLKIKDTQAYSLDTAHQFGLVAGSVSSGPVLAKVKYFTVLHVKVKSAYEPSGPSGRSLSWFP